MNGCGCNYWKELIKSAWGLATTSVRAAKTKDGTRYPDGDGVLDISDIAGGEGTVTSVNGKQPDAQGNVVIGSADISTPDGTVQGDLEDLGTNLASEISARTSGDEALQTAIDGKQDALTTAQLNAVNSGITRDKVTSYSMTTQNLTRLSNRVDTIDDSVTTAQTDISQLKISDAEHTETLADQATQLSAQATEITTIKSKDASQDSSISALQTKTANHDTEIQGLSESVVSDLTGTFTDSTRTLKLSLERESAPSIDCSVVIPGGGSGTAGVTSFNTKTGDIKQPLSSITGFWAEENKLNFEYSDFNRDGSVTAQQIEVPVCSDIKTGVVTPNMVKTWDSKQNALSTAQLNAANSGITSAKVMTYDGYATGKADASTVSQIQTAVGGCFNDASISGSTLNLTTVGGQTNSLTLPGGGGASLPTNGYYWEKITAENWPTDWADTDTLLISGTYTLHIFKGDTWTSSPFVVSNRRLPLTLTVSPAGTMQIEYYNIFKHNCVNFYKIEVKSSDILNSAGSSVILTISEGAFNGGGSTINNDIITLSVSGLLSSSSVYRLRPFLSS